MRSVESIKKSSGNVPQAIQRKDFGVGEGLPNKNLITRGSNRGQPQHPYAGPGKLFLDG